jgi:hypothetical protein
MVAQKVLLLLRVGCNLKTHRLFRKHNLSSTLTHRPRPAKQKWRLPSAHTAAIACPSPNRPTNLKAVRCFLIFIYLTLLATTPADHITLRAANLKHMAPPPRGPDQPIVSIRPRRSLRARPQQPQRSFRDTDPDPDATTQPQIFRPLHAESVSTFPVGSRHPVPLISYFEIVLQSTPLLRGTS